MAQDSPAQSRPHPGNVDRQAVDLGGEPEPGNDQVRLGELRQSTGRTPPGIVERERIAYEHGEHRPLGSFLAIAGGYGLVLGALGRYGRLRGVRLPDRPRPSDLALLTVACHRLARLISKDAVTSPLRAPFTRFDGAGQPGEVNEEVRGRGPRKALGELISCPFCVGQWVATALVAGSVLAPRVTRWAAAVLAVEAGSDALQFVRAMLANRAEAGPGS
ncbi:MAG TPA: DUF1360 domain-containing protein [Sporichthyaceae bacterium]|jgi:hypothetical protein|nr:DUF1360 domain-containing protein [Sporichthyaceae bacterium]